MFFYFPKVNLYIFLSIISLKIIEPFVQQYMSFTEVESLGFKEIKEYNKLRVRVSRNINLKKERERKRNPLENTFFLFVFLPLCQRLFPVHSRPEDTGFDS